MKTCISDRAFEIVESVIYHGSKKEAATALNRSLYTIETTIKNVYEQLGINKISDLTLWFCGVKFGISEQVTAFKNVALVLGVFFLMSIEGMNSDFIGFNQTRRNMVSMQNLGCTRRRRKEKALLILNFQHTISYAA